MKVFIVLFAIAAVACAEHTPEENEAWKNWKLEHSKLFLSGDKEKTRKATFLSNKNDVDAHNEAFLNGEETFTKQLHKFSDLTPEEFQARFTGVNAEEHAQSRLTPVVMRASYPASLDLRTTGGINAVKDQGGCGSCWSFSTNCPLEYAIWKKTGKLPNLAEQNLVDCVYGTSGGCQGGWMSTAYDYIKKAGGVACTSSYPYTAKNGACKASVAKAATITGYTQIASDDASIKSALANNGALTVCVDASSNFQAYKSGIFSDTTFQTTKPSLNHAVTLIGYGNASGQDFWLVRNSWNTWWGEQGHIRMAAGNFPSGYSKSGIFTNTCIAPTV